MQKPQTLKLNINKGIETPEAIINSDIHDYFYKQTRSIEECLVWCTEHSCSDLYIKVFERPYISRYGKIMMLPCTEITKDAWSKFYDIHVLNELNAKYVRQKFLDVSVLIRIPDNSPNFGIFDSNYYRYRASFAFSDERNIATFRMIRPNKPTFDTINYPKQCEQALHKALQISSGITYCTGPTGSGKSTTMAACINTFTEKDDILDNNVIITLEDPVENEFLSTTSVKIIQKELDKDFKDFALGIKNALREHPTTVIIGECRDKETIVAAISASRTGHRVMTTIHSTDVPGTVARLLYYLDNDKNLSYDLIINLNLIMSQKLIKSDDGYLVDTQYMFLNDEVTKILLNAVDNEENISVIIQNIIKDAYFLESKVVKDWDYADKH